MVRTSRRASKSSCRRWPSRRNRWRSSPERSISCVVAKANQDMPNPILEMSGVSKRFPGVLALEQVTLDVYPSEIVALVGENGAGKSTLMKILGGVIQGDAGAIRLDGEQIEIQSPSEASRRRIEFIH